MLDGVSALVFADVDVWSNRSQAIRWSGLGGGLLAGGPVARIFHWSARGFGVPAEYRFAASGREAIYEVPTVGGYVGAGLGMVFQ